MIRAAIAVKHKFGAVALTEAQIARCEAISGQKFSDTWLGKGNDTPDAVPLEQDEDGNYVILAENEKQKIENQE